MNKVLTVIRKEYLERVRAKSFIIGTVLGPVLMSAMVFMPLLLADKGGQDFRTVGVVDLTGRLFAPLEETLAVKGHDNVSVERIAVSPVGGEAGVDELKRRILNEELHSGIVIAADFYDSRQVSFYNQSVSSLFLREKVLDPSLAQLLRKGRFAATGVPDSLFTYLSEWPDWTTFSVTPEGAEEQANESMTAIMSIALIMIIYLMVIMYGSHTLTAVIEEKGSRMAEVLLSSISPGQLMLGKVMGIGAAGLTQFAIWTGAFFFLSQQGVQVGDFTLEASFLTPLILISFLVFFLLGFFLYATMYAGVGAMCNSVQDSQQFMFMNFFLVLPMLMLSLVMENPNSPLATVLSLIPLFSPVLMFMRVCLETPPVWQIGLSWGLMVVSIWLMSRAAGKLFRIGILMYGAAPTWGTLFKALRS
jgi:ABC-2 type transport system permease protein